MLNFNKVGFSYSGYSLFKDLSFSMNNGEFCFLIGKSGSGKSTLMQMIYMSLLPEEGNITFLDYDSSKIKPRQLPFLRRKLGIIFQELRLIKDRTLQDNLAFVLESTNTPKNEIKRKVNDVLSEVGLSHRRTSLPKTLSGGEQQRIAIARAIINNPILILADEPTGNLDPETSGEILDTLKKINSRGTAVLIATHNYELIRKADARIMKLDDGKISEVSRQNI